MVKTISANFRPSRTSVFAYHYSSSPNITRGNTIGDLILLVTDRYISSEMLEVVIPTSIFNSAIHTIPLFFSQLQTMSNPLNQNCSNLTNIKLILVNSKLLNLHVFF
jgi:hypothetical protein